MTLRPPPRFSPPAEARLLQGIGRHSLAEVSQRLAKDLDACVVLLEESGAYLTGPTPCQADCFLFSLVDSVRCLSCIVCEMLECLSLPSFLMLF